MTAKLFKRWSLIWPLILLVVVGVLIAQNYVPGTWLSGWDTLHPEFNFGLNFKRALWGVWREEQGVGALAAHSHMSELPRIALLWIANWFLPLNALRYFYFFITLLVGPLGVYYFLKHALGEKYSNTASQIGAFLGGLYYLLNLGTLQHYYVPFEMFATQFAFLPWIFLFAIKLIEGGKRTHALVLLALSLLAAPQAYAATLFYSFYVALSIFVVLYTVLSRKKVLYKRGLFSLLIVLSANLYWLLPNIYFALNKSEIIKRSAINELFSPEAHLINEQYGTLDNVLIHKSFLFSWRELDDSSGKFVFLLDEWLVHLEHPLVRYALFGAAALALFGIVAALFKKMKTSLPILAIFFFSLFFLINNNAPTGSIYTFLIESSSTIKEAMRMPYTKFSIIFMFAAAYFVANATGFAAQLIAKTGRLVKHFFVLVLVLFISILLVIPMLPAFEGNLVSNSMKVKIPEDYFLVQEWFNSQPYGRIAKFPVNSPYGWIYNDWGYEGAGFNWFGIESPMFDRDFDRWSQYNETFYKELSHAVYSENDMQFTNVLRKYDVAYLILDHSMLNSSGGKDGLYIKEIKEMLEKLSFISPAGAFGEIEIYRTGLGTEQGVYPLNSYSTISYDSTYASSDRMYEAGDYVQDEAGTLVPFENIEDRQNIKIAQEDGYLKIKKQIKDVSRFESITRPSMGPEVVAKLYVQYEVDTLRLRLEFIKPKLDLDGKNLTGENRHSVNLEILDLDEKPLFASINGQIINLRSIGEIERMVGEALIDLNKDNAVVIYGNEETREDILGVFSNSDARLCSDPNSTINTPKTQAGFELLIDGDSAVCLGGEFAATPETLTTFSFSTTSADSVSANFCLTQGDEQECIEHNPFKYLINSTSGKEKYEISLESSIGGNYWFDFVVHEASAGEIKYSDIKIYSTSKLAETSFDLADAREFFSTVITEIPHGLSTGDLSLSIPIAGLVQENFNIARGYSKPYNCEWDKKGVVARTVVGSSVDYSASDGGVSCDYYSYGDLSHATAYLLRIAGENHTGKSLKFFLFNSDNGHPELERLLPNGEFDKYYFIPPIDVESKGYSLNVETRAYGRINSRNTISRIEFIPIPNEWLSKVVLNPANGANTGNSTLEITNIKKYGTALYRFKSSSEDGGLVTLSQGFDNGWLAYAGGKRLEHVTVNSWANGWYVPAGEHRIAIFYWPQLLEWAGLVLLLPTLIALSSKPSRMPILRRKASVVYHENH